MRLAAGLRPDPLGELQRSPYPIAAIGREVLLLRGREGRERVGEGKGEERGREKREGSGLPLLYLTSGYRPVGSIKSQLVHQLT